MKNPKTILVVVVAFVLLIVGLVFFRSPKPFIEIKAEKLVSFGPHVSVGPVGILPFPLVNTYVSSVAAVIVLIVIGYYATRKAGLVPSGLQNAVEAVMEAIYNICVQSAGEKNGRRFFPVVITIFTFIWVANWMALLPFFNVIGSVEKVTAQDFQKQAVVFSKSAGISFISPDKKAIAFDAAAIQSTCAPFKTAPAGASAQEYAAEYDSCLTGQRGLAIATKLDDKEHTNSGVGVCQGKGTPGDSTYDHCLVNASDTALQQLHASGKQLGLLVPYFRSMNTDVNSPLSIAIMSAIFVESWGIASLGAFRYLSKFFTLRSPSAFFVGLLEFVAEVVRLISFTFRLFGNVLAGEILVLVIPFLVPFLLTDIFYGLEMFFGLIQAFIFAALTLVFGVLAVSVHDGHDEEEEKHGGQAAAAAAH